MFWALREVVEKDLEAEMAARVVARAQSAERAGMIAIVGNRAKAVARLAEVGEVMS